MSKIRPSLKYFEFNLISEVVFNEVEIAPHRYHFPTSLLIDYKYTSHFTLTNKSGAAVDYDVMVCSISPYLDYELSHGSVRKGVELVMLINSIVVLTSVDVLYYSILIIRTLLIYPFLNS